MHLEWYRGGLGRQLFCWLGCREVRIILLYVVSRLHVSDMA